MKLNSECWQKLHTGMHSEEWNLNTQELPVQSPGIIADPRIDPGHLDIALEFMRNPVKRIATSPQTSQPYLDSHTQEDGKGDTIREILQSQDRDNPPAMTHISPQETGITSEQIAQQSQRLA